MSTHALFQPMRWVLLVTLLILAIPLVAMQFTSEVVWTSGDFLMAALLLISAGTIIVLALRRVRSMPGRALVVAAVVVALLLVWAQLAVGLFS